MYRQDQQDCCRNITYTERQRCGECLLMISAAIVISLLTRGSLLNIRRSAPALPMSDRSTRWCESEIAPDSPQPKEGRAVSRTRAPLPLLDHPPTHPTRRGLVYAKRDGAWLVKMPSGPVACIHAWRRLNPLEGSRPRGTCPHAQGMPNDLGLCGRPPRFRAGGSSSCSRLGGRAFFSHGSPGLSPSPLGLCGRSPHPRAVGSLPPRAASIRSLGAGLRPLLSLPACAPGHIPPAHFVRGFGAPASGGRPLLIDEGSWREIAQAVRQRVSTSEPPTSSSSPVEDSGVSARKRSRRR